jgi:predicted component of type VI protein secretion system
LFSVNEDGVLSADPASCAAQGVNVTSVEKHILGLRLNVGRLRNQREAVRAALTQTYQIFSELQQPTFQQQLIAFAESQLLPNGSNRLSPFFTTSRSFFGPVAEQILKQPPHAWI